MSDNQSTLRLLLLGAGFSRNWGGFLGSEVFEYLLGCPEIGGDPYLRGLLWRNRRQGFEVALSELQSEFNRSRVEFGEPLEKFQRGITSMFAAMNTVFSAKRFDFPPPNIPTTVTYFLSQFDAIFTLNQDLLLEAHYLGCNFSSGKDYRQWSGQEPPGLQLVRGRAAPEHLRWFHNTWRPLPEVDFRVRPGIQPIYKLHGSSNWVTEEGSEVLVMGGGKEEAIAEHPILAWYAREFSHALRHDNARLMIIGYGFRDHHINRAIAKAVYERGLRLFVIGPDGSDAATVFRSPDLPQAALTVYGYDLEDVFAHGLIGASRRRLSEIFGDDTVEHAKVMRFFD